MLGIGKFLTMTILWFSDVAFSNFSAKSFTALELFAPLNSTLQAGQTVSNAFSTSPQLGHLCISPSKIVYGKPTAGAE